MSVGDRLSEAGNIYLLRHNTTYIDIDDDPNEKVSAIPHPPSTYLKYSRLCCRLQHCMHFASWYELGAQQEGMGSVNHVPV